MGVGVGGCGGFKHHLIPENCILKNFFKVKFSIPSMLK